MLPEMFSTGFSMAADDLAEPMDGETMNWAKDIARTRQVTLCGSLIIRESGHHFNRFVWIDPEGAISWYDKRHLFRMADEHQYFTAGQSRQIIETSTIQKPSLRKTGMRLLPQICYDLRFPAWSRHPGQYDVLLYVANWPAVRREHWLALLRARAIENQCYVIAVNRIGTDGNNVDYAGDSCAIDPQGSLLVDLGDRDVVAEFEPDLESLARYRATFPAHKDADQFEFIETSSLNPP